MPQIFSPAALNIKGNYHYYRQTTSKFSPAAPIVVAIPLVLYKEKQGAAGAKKYSLHAFLIVKPFKIIHYFCA